MFSPEPFCRQETKCIHNALGIISMIKLVQYLIIFPPLVKVLPVRSVANEKSTLDSHGAARQQGR